MDGLDIYCVTNKHVNFLKKNNYKIAWVGQEKPNDDYILCNYKINIFNKEKFYSELTFHYWYWKNLLNIRDKKWIGFCQKRRFWINPESEINKIDINNINDHLLKYPHESWKDYESIICKPINISGAKKIKIIKRGWRTIIKDPTILYNSKKETIKFHFDMHHGHGNLDKAISLLDQNDRIDFMKFVSERNSFNPHIMMISRPEILDRWFDALFKWLEKCEEIFKPETLRGYDTTRLYAYLAERYLSYWFRKNTKYLESPWIFIDN